MPGGVGGLLSDGESYPDAEYALKDIAKPVGISEYRLIESISEDLQGDLPSIEQIKAELSSVKKR